VILVAYARNVYSIKGQNDEQSRVNAHEISFEMNVSIRNRRFNIDLMRTYPIV
jgi:hypothetical protein